MSATQSIWYAVSQENETTLHCAACAAAVDLRFPMADHHPRSCPACGAECAFLDWNGRMIQVVTDRAPKAVAHTLRWIQKNLDELDYVELLCAFAELADALHGQEGDADISIARAANV